MGHPALMRGYIHIPSLSSTLCRRDDRHVLACFDFGEEQALGIDPSKTGGVWQPQLLCTAKDRHQPSVPAEPTVEGRVADTRTIGRKDWAHLWPIVVCELNGLSRWEHLDIDLTRRQKCTGTMDKGDHATIRRERGLSYRIRKIGELDVLGAPGSTSMRVKEKKYRRYDSCRDARKNELRD